MDHKDISLMTREDLVKEIIAGLPDPNMITVVNSAAVHILGKVVVLKEKVEREPDSWWQETETYSKPFAEEHNLEELLEKDVMFAPEVFNRQALLAFIELFKRLWYTSHPEMTWSIRRFKQLKRIEEE
ncbi:hypothetical protein SP3_00046 [Bacillus phage fHSPT3]